MGKDTKATRIVQTQCTPATWGAYIVDHIVIVTHIDRPDGKLAGIVVRVGEAPLPLRNQLV